MEKSCHSSVDSTSSTVTTAASSGKDGNPYQHKHLSLNKLSHKISKQPTPLTRLECAPKLTTALDQHHLLPGNLQQPPVYNINKSDFREVVQKLTGSPAHERLSSPPPIQPPKPPSSRLQRIRPPPLSQLSARPLPLLNTAPSLPQNQSSIHNNQIRIPPPTSSSISDMSTSSVVAAGFNPIGRATAPLSPLPPLPSVHAAAESPVSAYMRYLQNAAASGDSRPFLHSGFSPMAPTATLSPAAPAPSVAPPPQFQQPFGCLNSPRSPYPLLSPGLLFSPSSGQLGFPQIPLSPTVPMLSPRYRGCI